MFSGIVEKLGRVVSVTKNPGKSALIKVAVGKLAKGVRVGDSVCVNGVCLTVTGRSRGVVLFDAIEETLRVTNLGELRKGSRVDIERSIMPTDRIGGHFVTGHIDGVGKIMKIEKEVDASVKMWIESAPELTGMMIRKGSVAVDGISLTLVDVAASRFSVCLIPHTLSVTTLGQKTEGDSVNLEVDMIGKYVRKYLEEMNTQLP